MGLVLESAFFAWVFKERNLRSRYAKGRRKLRGVGDRKMDGQLKVNLEMTRADLKGSSIPVIAISPVVAFKITFKS